MKKIILLGASGQLGGEWQHYFSGSSTEIILLPYTSGQLDVTDTAGLNDELTEQQPDVVINCAAYTNVDGAEEHREQARRVNVEAAADLAELATKLNFMLVHYSTDYIFPGRAGDRHSLPQGYPVDYAANPVNFYGRTKWEGEEMIRSHTDNYLILRVSWLCGVYGSNFVKTMLRLGQERAKLQVVNDQWGSPSFAENVVTNTQALLKTGKRGTFHITSSGLITWHQFAEAIFQEAGIDVATEAVSSEQFPTAADRPHFSKLNTGKLADLEQARLEDWRTGLKKMLAQLEEA